MRKNLIGQVEQISEELCKDLGFELVDVEYVKEAGENFLRIYLDTEQGISIDECEVFSRAISKELDKKDFIEEQYFLEVSSPGIDRVLKKDKDFIKYQGRDVDVKLYASMDGLKQFEAILLGLNDDGKINLEVDGKDRAFDRKDIAQIRLAVKF